MQEVILPKGPSPGPDQIWLPGDLR
jgi:hypothetical protein